MTFPLLPLCQASSALMTFPLLPPCQASSDVLLICPCHHALVRRGYSDDLPSAAALNTLVNEGEAVLIDIRSSKEKEASGVPDLPSSATSKVGGVGSEKMRRGKRCR